MRGLNSTEKLGFGTVGILPDFDATRSVADPDAKFARALAVIFRIEMKSGDHMRARIYLDPLGGRLIRAD